MKREPVRSSVIAEIGYDPDMQLMEVRFRSGSVYRYGPVSRSLYTRFRTAPSLGRFFDAHIRDVVPYVQVS